MSEIVWSYSFLSTYERCARQAEARYVTKELKFVESPEAAHGNRVHKALENRIKGAAPLPEDLQAYQKYIDRIKSVDRIAMAELELGVTRDWKPTTFFARNVRGRCKLDVVMMQGNDALIFDWKTGKVWEDPKELEIQALMLQIAYPHLEQIMGAYVWLKEDEYGPVYDLTSTLGKTKKWVEKTISEVEKCIWYPTKNKLCPWCQVSTCRFYKETRKEKN